MSLQGKVALVTGSDSGIGSAVGVGVTTEGRSHRHDALLGR